MRAVRSDRRNALILRQFPTFERFWDKYQERGFGECLVCARHRMCDRCSMLQLCDTSGLPKDFTKLMFLSDIIEHLLNQEPKRQFGHAQDQEKLDNVLETYETRHSKLKKVTKALAKSKRKPSALAIAKSWKKSGRSKEPSDSESESDTSGSSGSDHSDASIEEIELS